MLSRPSANKRKARAGKCSIPFRPRTPASWRKACRRPSPARPLSGTPRARRREVIFFSAMTQPPHEPPHRRVAHGFARHTLQVAPPFWGGRRSLGEIRLQQPPRWINVVAFRWPARRLPRSQRDPIALHPGEALHRGEAHPEEAGSLVLGSASLEGADYLASEIFRVGFHACIVSCGSMFLLTAVSVVEMVSKVGTPRTTPISTPTHTNNREQRRIHPAAKGRFCTYF